MSLVDAQQFLSQVMGAGAFRPPPCRTFQWLEKWKLQELEGRRRIDAIVREWLSLRRWPQGLLQADEDAARLRCLCVYRWLDAARAGEPEMPVRLDRLLIVCWPGFLQQLVWQMECEIDAYSLGLRN